MKWCPLCLSLVLAGFGLPFVNAGTFHEFSSKDGSRSLQAEILAVNVSRKTIRLKTSDGQVIDAPMSAFSEGAVDHARDFLAAMESGRRLGFYFDEAEAETSEKKEPSRGQATLTTPTGYLVKVRNNGQSPMEDIEFEYQLFYSEDLVNSGKSPRVASGSFALGSLLPGEEKELATEKVDLVRMKKLPASECTGSS